MSGQIMMFSQRQHAMLARPAENGQQQPVNLQQVDAKLHARVHFDTLYKYPVCNLPMQSLMRRNGSTPQNKQRNAAATEATP